MPDQPPVLPPDARELEELARVVRERIEAEEAFNALAAYEAAYEAARRRFREADSEFAAAVRNPGLIARLVEDSARLDWLGERSSFGRNVAGQRLYVMPDDSTQCGEWRELIDAARTEEARHAAD